MTTRKVYHVNKREGKIEDRQRASVTGPNREEVVKQTIELTRIPLKDKTSKPINEPN